MMYNTFENTTYVVITIMKGRFILEQDISRKIAVPDDPELYIKEYLDLINGEVI